MYVRTWNKNGTYYASLVESKRIGKSVKQETICYIGVIDESQIPYLKAAFAKKKPKLVYDDGTVYECH